MQGLPSQRQGDAARLRQVVVNLLSNAVKFTAAGGHVHVAVTSKDESAVLVVRDNGIGTVAAESAGVGRGSQFTVMLPCAVITS